MEIKKYVLQVLEIVKGIRFPAFWWIYMIEQWYVDNSLLGTLHDILEKAIHRTEDTFLKHKLQKSLDLIDRIHILEQKTKIHDDSDLSELEVMISELE